MKTYVLDIDSPVGTIELSGTDSFLNSLKVIDSKPSAIKTDSSVLNKAKKQLEEYFEGKRQIFDLPLKQKGTDFQQKVWTKLLQITYGETISYKKLAESVGDANASRAVGSANGKNNIAIIVPCHRVVNADGRLGGYAYGIDVKQKLIELEAKHK